MAEYVCSRCGEPAYFDGRCKDGPVLTCNCTKQGRWINDGRGGYWVPQGNAKPVRKDGNGDR
jgi:hypothetical protein